jgi:hypothetical protein
MNLEELTLQEKHELAVVVTLACVRRLEVLLQRSDPQDSGLQSLLNSLARKALDRAEELEQDRLGAHSGGPSKLAKKDVEGLISQYFPSFKRSLGEGCLDREAGTYLAECLEAECAAFYQSLAEGLEDCDSRTLFRTLGKQDLSFLDFVRHVLL